MMCSPLLQLVQLSHPVAGLLVYIILSILPSRCAIPTIHSSQGLCTYFKTARKCAIFEICCEGIPRQVNYLIDEASDTGKGANTVVSLLHHFLGHHALGEVEMGLHADNCSGQNKHNMVLWVSVDLQFNYAIGYLFFLHCSTWHGGF